MRKNIFTLALASIFAFTALMSCGGEIEPELAPEKDIKPSFPSTVLNETVAAGSSVDVKFTPNMDWEVNISGEGSGNYFWIDDSGMKVTKMSGKAQESQVSVTVEFSADEEFDKNRVCEVTLKMKGESKKIATLTRPSLSRTFETYAAVADETGYTSQYSSEQLKDAVLKSFGDDAEYTIPVKVVTNFAWNIVLPSWLKALNSENSEISAGEAGTTEFLLQAVLTKDVVNGVAGEVKFIDRSNTDASYQFNISLPSFAERWSFQVNSLTFNKEAQVLMPNGSYADQSAIGYLFAAEGAVVRALEWNGKWHDTKYASWVDIKIGEYDSSMGVLQTVPVTLDVSANTDPERYADIFVFPVSKAGVKAEEICDMNSPVCAFKEEYAKYHIGRLIQGGIVPPYITPVSTAEEMAEAGLSFINLETDSDDNIMKEDLKAPVYHKMIYHGDKAQDAASFNCLTAYSKVKIFSDSNFPFGEFTKDVTSDESFWLTFTPAGNNLKGCFTLRSVPTVTTHAAAVFYDSDNKALAAVLIEFRPSSQGGGDIVIDDDYIITLKSGEAEVVKLTEGEVYEVISSNYSISHVYQVTALSSPVSLSSAKESWNHFYVDPATYQEVETASISMENNATYFNFYPSGDQKQEMIVVFQTVGADGQSQVNYAAVHFIYNPVADIEIAPVFEFAYPEMVSGASLSLYTGSMLSAILTDFGGANGLKESRVWELKYTVAEPQMAMIKVPSLPFGDAAWNNYPPMPNYWLTYEKVNSDTILVKINTATAKNNDYFVFKDADGLFYAVLVCTYAPEQ